jgi:hypothetical protein
MSPPTTQRDERVLVAWTDDLNSIVPLCHEFEDKLIQLVWNRHVVSGASPGPSIPITPALSSAINSAADIERAQERELTSSPESALEPNAKPISGGSLWGWRIGSRAKRAPAPQDVEKGGPSLRPTKYFGPFYSGLALALSTCAVSSSTEQLFILTGDLKTSWPAVSAPCS